MHLILRDFSKHPIQKVLGFLNDVPDLYKVSSNVSADGRKAGQYYVKQAQTILCEAAKSDNHLRIVLALINADTVVDNPKSSFSPIMCAAEHGSTEVIKALIAHRASVDRCNVRKETSLFIACHRAQWDAAKLLYDNGADPLITNEDGDSAFTVAKERCGVALLQHMAKKDAGIRQILVDCLSLSDACKYGYDLVASNYDIDSLSAEEIKDAVTQSCFSRSTAILENFSTKLDDLSLSMQMGKAYQAGHCDCLAVLIKFCSKRKELPCPDISLAETCKHINFANLTYFLIEKGQHVNKDHGEPLRNAAEYGNMNAVKYLIQYGADVNLVSSDGVTPLLLASKGNHLDVVDILLKYTADVNIETNKKETPLTISCKTSNLQLVNLLLSSNPVPDLNQKNHDEKTPLEIAIDNQQAAIAMALFKKGANLPLECTSQSNDQFLKKLCHVGKTDLVKRYLQIAKRTVAINEQVLYVVVKAGNVELLKLLLSSDNVSVDSKVIVAALRYACTTGSVSIVKLLTDYDYRKFWQSVQEDNESHLHAAIRYENALLVSFLLDTGCIPRNNCPVSAAFGSEDILKCVLKYDIPTTSLNTSLMAVCRSPRRTAELHSCARQLLDRSAYVNYQDIEDPDHLTVLIAATLKSSISLVRLLLERGADPNIRDNKERSPFLWHVILAITK